MNHKHSKTTHEPQTTLYAIRKEFTPSLSKGSQLRKIHSFIQNKPNSQNAQMNVNKVLTKDYENARLAEVPKTNPIYQMPKMNVKKVLTMHYEENSLGWLHKNKPNFYTKNSAHRL